MSKTEELIKLIQENPDLPVVPMVDTELVADDCYAWWLGGWGWSKVIEYYIGREHIHFKDDDQEDALVDMIGCKYSCTEDGRDVFDLSDEEWEALYESLPWTKAIAVYITTP